MTSGGPLTPIAAPDDDFTAVEVQVDAQGDLLIRSEFSQMCLSRLQVDALLAYWLQWREPELRN